MIYVQLIYKTKKRLILKTDGGVIRTKGLPFD